MGRPAARHKFFSAFFPPDFASRWGEIVEGISESLWMTVVSTVVGIALSIPVGIGAAQAISPPPPVYYFCRGILAVSRSFQEIILAIFFVKLFGFGPFAGARDAVASRPSASTASCSPKTSRTWMPAQAEAVRATGAGWLQWINYGVQPQVMPRMIGLGLYRFDINFRELAVVGIVGGGGIGATLEHRVRPLRIQFRGGDPAGHHRHRHGCANTRPAICGAGCSDGDRTQRRGQGLAAARARRAVRWCGVLARGARRFSSYCWQLISEKTIWAFVTDAPAQAGDLAARMVPPDWGFIRQLGRPIWDTINIATLGTAMAIVLAVPVAYCAARNTTPSVALVRPVGAVHHRVVALDQLADLGADAGHHHRPGRVRRHHRHRPALDRLLRQAAVRGDRGDRREPGRGGARDRRERRAGDGLRHRAAGAAGLRRHLGVPLGHQHPRSRRCSGWSAPAASACRSTPRSPRWPGPRCR